MQPLPFNLKWITVLGFQVFWRPLPVVSGMNELFDPLNLGIDTKSTFQNGYIMIYCYFDGGICGLLGRHFEITTFRESDFFLRFRFLIECS